MIKVYWWRSPDGGFNLGDEITSLLLTRYFSVSHELDSIWNADLVSTGSLLNWVWGTRFKFRQRPLGVVGSGFMLPPAGRGPSCCRLYSVRGHLSEQLLSTRARDLSIGDPALLVSRLFPRQEGAQPRTHRFGIIAHHSRPDLGKAWVDEQSGDVKFIDMRTDDLGYVVDQIRSCEVVISQALHGLIIADSLGVPNIWIDDGALHAGHRFKFYDYFSSVGRPFGRVVSPKDLADVACLEDNVFELGERRLGQLQGDVAYAFLRYFNDFDVRHVARFQ